MNNILEQLRECCPTPELVRIYAYGYLDQAMMEFADEKITEQVLRRQHYMLTAAVESRLNELEKAARIEALRRLMINRQEAFEREGARITDR